MLHMGAETDDHRFQHVIGLNVERLRGDFRGRMAVADVPGDASK